MDAVYKNIEKQSESAKFKSDPSGFTVCSCVADEDEDELGVAQTFSSILTQYDEDGDNFATQLSKPWGYIDLESMIVCTEEEGKKLFSEQIEGILEETEEKPFKEGHPIIKPYKSIGPCHFSVVLHPSASLCQVIGSDLIEDIQILFEAIVGESLIVGFNSLNAGAPQNKLHVEALLVDRIGLDELRLPLLDLETVSILKSSLKARDETTAELPVSVSVHKTIPRFFKIECDQFDQETLQEAQASTAFILGLLLTELIASKIAHNIIFYQGGTSAILYPRSGANKELGWLDLMGLTRFPKQNITKTHWEATSISAESFNSIGNTLSALIHSKYH